MSAWQSFHPRPRLHVAGALGILSHEVLSLGCMPVNSLQRRIVIVSNTWDLPVAFEWDLDQMAHEVGCIDGELTVTPASGRLEVGERAMCKLVFKSGLRPQILEGEIRCTIQPTQDALDMNEQLSPRRPPHAPTAVLCESYVQPDEVTLIIYHDILCWSTCASEVKF